ncbi:SDR family oxidoreductase [Hymenobacter sediminis]|uniref:SDR family oxidoreductase n=1 Tax=Hymenobacter sediminis TaxID=2218621 RepID=UPI000DA6D4A1|nr:SDR family oxidoreductase [Hymenobacter sediminis]RPD44307.1 SDR family oxidoreductase [Hymenobacter sediminis]
MATNPTKTILITGASSGIGLATARYFAQRGWQVAATMRTPHKAPADLHSLANVLVLPLDVLDVASIEAAVAAARHAFGRLDVLFNNAGYALAGAFEALSPAQVQQQFDTNVYGVMNVTRAVLPHFRERRQGLVLTTTSVGGHMAFPLYSVYNATKFAVEGFMEGLQYEVQQFNIQVRTIVPGTVRTDFTAAIQYVPAPAYDPYAQRVHEQTLASYAHAATPESVARVVFAAATRGGRQARVLAGSQPKLVYFLRWLLPHQVFAGLINRTAGGK